MNEFIHYKIIYGYRIRLFVFCGLNPTESDSRYLHHIKYSINTNRQSYHSLSLYWSAYWSPLFSGKTT